MHKPDTQTRGNRADLDLRIAKDDDKTKKPTKDAGSGCPDYDTTDKDKKQPPEKKGPPSGKKPPSKPPKPAPH